MTDIFRRFGITPVINATGTVTRLGASPIDAEVIAAMAAAARCSVDIGELQGRASEVISECTGAEAGIVTSGAMAGLLVGTAACLAGFDPLKMSRLPDTAGMRNEFIVSRSHRNSYDHGVRAAGARLVEVGLPRPPHGMRCARHGGVGVRGRHRRTDRRHSLSRARGFPAGPCRRRAGRPCGPRTRTGRRGRGTSAGAQSAPIHRRRRRPRGVQRRQGGRRPLGFGDSVRAPRSGGFALLQQLDLDCLYEDWQPPAQLVDKKALRGVPRHGIGRSCKVGKEQIVGLLTALVRFTEDDDAARNGRFGLIVGALAAALGGLRGLRVRTVADPGHGGMPLLEIVIPEEANKPTAVQVASRLRAASPAVHVDSTNADAGILMLVPTCLGVDDAAFIGTAFAVALGDV